MSTKIYNAYRLQHGADVFQLRREARDQLVPLLLHMEMQRVVDDAVASYDNALSQGREVTFRESIIERFKEFNDDNPNGLRDSSIVVFQNFKRDERYIMCFGTLTRLDAANILGLSTIESDFSYWNNSDEPEGMSEEAWEDRGLAWDEAMDDPYENVRSQGVTIELFSRYQAYFDLRKLAQVREQLVLPSVEQRVNKLSMSMYVTKHIESAQLQGSGDFMYEVSSKMDEWARGKVTETTRASFTTRAGILLDRNITLDF